MNSRPETRRRGVRRGLVQRHTRWSPVVLSGLGVIVHLWNQSPLRRIDFHIYVGAVSQLGSRSLYDYRHPVTALGFTYPPFAAMVLWPLSLGSTAFSEHVWLILTVVLGATMMAVGVSLLPDRPTGRWFVPVASAIGLWSVPLVLTARLGQINALIAIAVMVDVVAVHHGWRVGGWRVGGVGIGVAAAVKLTPALLIPFLLIAGRRADAARAAATTVVLTGVAWLAFPSDSSRFWRTELWATDRVGSPTSAKNNSLRRLVNIVVDAAVGRGAGENGRTVVWLVISVGLIAVVFVRARRAMVAGEVLAAFTVVMCLTYAISPITWSHHLYFAPLAVLLVAGSCRSPWRVGIAVVMAVAFIDPFTGGEGATLSVVRALMLVYLCVAAPVTPQKPFAVVPTDLLPTTNAQQS